jgi:hypothetical protein
MKAPRLRGVFFVYCSMYPRKYERMTEHDLLTQC